MGGSLNRCLGTDPLFEKAAHASGCYVKRRWLKRFGFRGRVEEALVAAGLPAEAAKAEAAWLNWDRGGRGLRNALAHGDVARLASGTPTDDVLRLQSIVRLALASFLGFSFRLSADPGAFAMLDLSTDVGVTAAYNRALELRLHDVISPLIFA